MKKKLSVTFLLCIQLIVFTFTTILAQEKIIQLEQSMPVSPKIENLKETTIDSNPAKRIVYNVTNPTLIHYPADNNLSGTSVIIAPGGALQILSIDNEGIEVAKYLNKQGIDAFVLKYSLYPTSKDPFTELNENFFSGDAKRDSMISEIIPYAMKDGLSAISYVRKNATELKLNPNRIGFMGFSAGGTVTMSVVYNCNDENRPNFIAAIYPWIGEIKGKVPEVKTPAFIAVANDDHLKLVPHSMEIYKKWNAAKQPTELHVFGKGGHGFGVDKNYNPTDEWINQFVSWLGGEGLLWPEKPQGFFSSMSYNDYQKMQDSQQELLKTDWGGLKRYSGDNVKVKDEGKKNSIVFYGNSITDFWIRADNDFFQKNNFIDRGISGQTTSQMLVRFREDVVQLNPSAVVILAGTNDIAENTGPISIENIFGNIVSMVEIAKANNIKSVLCSVHPVYQYSWNKKIEPVGKIKELNRLIKQYADANDIPYADYYSAFVDERGGIPDKYSQDGVHPNLAGYKLMEQIVSKEIIKAELRQKVEY
nr:GDSL-type esterase/lipase family protein [uncultured Draconibacterium sp.]